MRSAIWAIWADTWRQSRHQIVYVLLVFALLAAALGGVLFVKVQANPSGDPVLTLRWKDGPALGLDAMWDREYRQAVAGQWIQSTLRQPREDARRFRSDLQQLQRQMARTRSQPISLEQRKLLDQRLEEARARVQDAAAELARVEQRVLAEAQVQVDKRARGFTALAKGVEVWSSKVAVVLLWIIMFGFTSTAAGYFPGIMKAGAIDLVVAKPIHRFQLFFGKYIGGLGLGSAALLASELVVVVGLGISTGVWQWSMLAAFPLTLLSLSLLFAVVILVGVVTRSGMVSLLGGYAYYLLVDTLLWGIQSLDSSGIKIQWLDPVARVSRLLFPGFARLRTAAEAAVVHLPMFDWQPVMLASIWLLGLLATGYTLFRRIDF